MVAAGGAVIGGGIGLMHFTGMRALMIPGTLGWDRGLVLASIAIGIVLASAALLAWHELERRKALWIAPGLLDGGDLRAAFHGHGRRDGGGGPPHRRVSPRS